MIKTIFGEIKNGRILRLPYFGYSVLLFVLMLAFMIGIGLMIGVAEQMMGGDLQQAQDQIRQHFTLPFMIIFALFMAVLLFAGLNLMAKRLRDIGLPGWWTTLGLIVLSAVVAALVSDQAGSVVNTLVWLALLFIPSNSFNKTA